MQICNYLSNKQSVAISRIYVPVTDAMEPDVWVVPAEASDLACPINTPFDPHEYWETQGLYLYGKLINEKDFTL